MMNDTVREELQTKIMPGVAVRTAPARVDEPAAVVKPPTVPQVSAPIPSQKIPAKRPVVETSGLSAPKTSQTLVDFQNKSTAVPDWRLQLQNAVQQRRGASASTGRAASLKAAAAPVAVREPVAMEAPAETAEAMTDPRVANAMRRIAESRKAFSGPEAVAVRVAKPRQAPAPAPARSFGIVPNPVNRPVFGHPSPSLEVRTAAKPHLVPSEAQPKRETNKLPQIEVPVISPNSGELNVRRNSGELSRELPEMKRIQIRAEMPDIVEDHDIVDDDIEDLAPISMRFGAGLFDMIIAIFATMVLISPVAFTNPNWFTLSGLLTFAGACAIVLFVYMTSCIGFFGKTPGMRLFSLELVDAVENEYPTLHQAAVSSSVYILSLIVGGLGFTTMFFNEEKRAVHDLLSGTILVRDF